MPLKADFIEMTVITNPAVRFISVKGDQWDDANGVMATAPTYADTAITLAENANINGIPIFFPAGLPSGDYHMMIYDAAAPANTDAYDRWYRIGWAQQAREILYIKDMAPMA